jgi:hypothetical protein
VAAAVAVACLAGCGTGPLVGLVYTNVKLPLTRDLDATPFPPDPPRSNRVVEVKEPFSGLGMYARVNSNAIGDIARQYGVDPLYFADQEVFGVLGIWKTQRVLLYGGSPDAANVSAAERNDAP